MKSLSYFAIIAVCLLTVTFSLQAAYITYHDEVTADVGTGFGNVLQTLALQQHGSADTQAGSVLWNGANDVLSGDAKPQSQTVTVAELAAKGFDASNLIVILNLNQTGSNPALDVHAFTMRFYTSADGSSFFDATYDINDARNTGSTLALAPIGNGLGTGQAGNVFRITFEGSEAADFFANSNHRIGALVTTAMDNEANAGADVFYMGDADIMDVQVIPEPATLAFLILSGLAFLARKRRVTRA